MKRAVISVAAVAVIVGAAALAYHSKIGIPADEGSAKPAPEVAGLGIGWINSKPLTLKELRGKVVLVDFWEYTCVNCLRTLPYLEGWNKRYAGRGLVIIGVHTPEFNFSGKPHNVRAAVRRLGITYPVVLDSKHQIWDAYSNEYWPHEFLIDAHGIIRHEHIGEGGYQHTEEWIQRLLREAGAKGPFPLPMAPVTSTDRPGAVCYPATPETYVGYERGHIGNTEGYSPDHVIDYAEPGQLQESTCYASGRWRDNAESLSFDGGRPGAIIMRYKASEVNVVVHPGAGDNTIVATLDGKPIPRDKRGAGVHEVNGRTVIYATEPRMYRVISEKGYGTHTLRLQTSSNGLGVFAFTFGACEVPGS